jgi:starvation-inducible outer membrane lipoprotein
MKQASLSLLLGFIACTACQSYPRPLRQHQPPIVSTTAQAVAQPTIEQFTANLWYPYKAPRPRRIGIENAAHKLTIGATEEEVKAKLGQPDYKAPNMRELGKHRFQAYQEVWHYVHTWEKPISPYYHGKMLVVTLTNESVPRVVVHIYNEGLD